LKFCSRCAAPLEERIPPGEDRPRKVCPACGFVHYLNPVPVVGTVVERGAEILLCRRAIEPGRGAWTVPAGFLELGEGAAEGARRETREEACADVELVAPLAILDLPLPGQCYTLYRARLTAPRVAAGEESLEVGFVHPDDIPWDELAFPVVACALRLLLEDRAGPHPHLHTGVLRWSGQGSRFDEAHYELEDHQRFPLRH
jgi:ADP-ribose/FAD diphosphatase